VTELFVTDSEYPTYFATLNGLRGMVVDDLLPLVGSEPSVLDVPTGYGFFAVELARRLEAARVVGVDISADDVASALENVRRAGLGERVKVMQMDACDLAFPPATFEAATSFLGLEDIHMTRGREGVRRSFSEIARVLRPGGIWCFAAMPPEEMETPSQRLEVAVFSELCGSTWLSAAEYEAMWTEAAFDLVARHSYRTWKKLNPEQAREEIEFACQNVPAIYGVPVPPAEEVLARYGADIEKHGMGHYSKVVCFHLKRRRP